MPRPGTADIRFAQDVLGGGAAARGRRDGHTNAGSDVHLALLQVEGRLELIENPPGHALHIRWMQVTSIRMTNSSPPNRATVWLERRGLTRRSPRPPWQSVARGMAEAVVDHLEAVQVQEEHGHAVHSSAIGGQLMGQAVHEKAAIDIPVSGS